MAEQKVHEVSEVGEGLEGARDFWEKYKNIIIGISAAIILIAGGWILYKNYIVKPKEERASEAMFKAEEFFRNDSLKLALNGDGQNKGFLNVIKNFDGTKAANLAHFYAGIIYLKTNDFNNAVKYLKDFSTDSKQIQMIAYGRLADAYSEQGKKDDAVNNYKKAGSYFPEDEANSSEFLFRAGYLLEAMGKNKEAVDVYKEIKDKFPKTEKGFSIDKYIYRLSVEKNDFSVK
ncbi:tetratricopeptide repeat protein [Segetibacter koreensis]|uniref:tetratricopeptide repeat protein n=1 Tax=Segetibacter koreensis TaxID=398037 RepID=UPI000362D026|nr:tetratricopeptide repeat protein [Segetibacter koreensis]